MRCPIALHLQLLLPVIQKADWIEMMKILMTENLTVKIRCPSEGHPLQEGSGVAANYHQSLCMEMVIIATFRSLLKDGLIAAKTRRSV